MPLSRLLRALRMRRLASGTHRWRRLSGRWTIGPLEGPHCSQRSGGPRESMLLLGGSESRGGLEASIRILEASDQAAGGAIVYVDVLGPQDFLSFHFCPAKQLVECFARTNGRWQRMGLPVHFPITVGTEHRVELRCDGPVRRLRVDGRDLLALRGRREGGYLGLGAKICPVSFSQVRPIPEPAAEAPRRASAVL